jgi:hypothetical protein
MHSSSLENWVSEQVAAGKPVDLSQFDHFDPAQNVCPCSQINGIKLRRLSASFLRNIIAGNLSLVQDPALGVRIKYAHIKEAFDISDIKVKQSVVIEYSMFEEDFLADRSVFEGLLALNGSHFYKLSLTGSKIESTLDISDIELRGPVLLDEIDIRLSLVMKSINKSIRHDYNITKQLESKVVSGKATTNVHMFNMKVGKNLDFSDSIFKSNVVLDGSEIGSTLLCRDTIFIGGVFCKGVRVGGTMEVTKSTFKTVLDMGGFHAAGSLLLHKGSFFGGNVHLVEANIGGGIDASESRFEGKIDPHDTLEQRKSLNLEGASIGARFIADRSEFIAPVHIIATKIHGPATFDGAHIKELIKLNESTIDGDLKLSGARDWGDADMSRLKVTGELQLEAIKQEGKQQMWQPTALLNLDDAHIDAIQVKEKKSWPNKLSLSGLTYERVSGPTSQPFSYIDWLNLDNNHQDGDFRPQPYEQMTYVLRRMGYEREAREIAIEKQKKMRESSQMSCSNRLWSRILQITVAYGYKPGRIIIFAFIINIIGAIIFSTAELQRHMVPVKESAYIKDTEREILLSSSVRPNFMLFVPSAENDYSTFICKPSIYLALGGIEMPKDLIFRINSNILSPNYPTFCALLYSLDAFLPIVNLHQEDYWLPSATMKYGKIYWFYLWFHIICGWVMTTLLVATLTGLIRRD